MPTFCHAPTATRRLLLRDYDALEEYATKLEQREDRAQKAARSEQR